MTFREDDSSDHRAPISDDTQRILPRDLNELADPEKSEYRQSLTLQNLRAKDLKLQIALTGHLPDRQAELATRARTFIEIALRTKEKQQ